MKCLIYIFLVFNYILPAQQKDSLKKSPSVLLGINLQPALTGDVLGSYNDGVATGGKHTLSPRFVLNGGLQTLIKIRRNWFLNSGVSFTELGYKEQIIPFLNYIGEETRNITYKHYYITANVLAQYKFKMMYFGLGLNTAHYQISKIIENGTTVVTKNPIRIGPDFALESTGYWLLGLQARIGIQLKINNKLYFMPDIFICGLRTTSRNFPYYGGGDGFFLTGLNLTLQYKIK